MQTASEIALNSLKTLREELRKSAFQPMPPDQPQMAMDPAMAQQAMMMQGGGGGMPMGDPSMMQQPMPPGGGGMPMDPMMAQGGGGMPMDPSMMQGGGEPPVDPAAGGPEMGQAIDAILAALEELHGLNKELAAQLDGTMQEVQALTQKVMELEQVLQAPSPMDGSVR